MMTEQLPKLEVEVWPSTARELVLQMFIYAHKGKMPPVTGKAWVEETENAMSPELREALSAFGAGLMELATVAYETRSRSVSTFVQALRSRHSEAENLVTLWQRDLFAEREEWLDGILGADAERVAARAAALTPQKLVDEATNGLQLAPDQPTDRIVLSPSWIMRPFAADSRLDRTLIIDYPVCDECLYETADEASMQRVLRLTRVLSDEVRLRALKKVAEEPSTLQQLADHVGVGKSTMHHHIAAMRAAGLLSVRMGTKVYSLRREALDDLPRGLRGFLGRK